jgi:hypothetical protein
LTEKIPIEFNISSSNATSTVNGTLNNATTTYEPNTSFMEKN